MNRTLNTCDFRLLGTEGKSYVFLTGSQEVMELKTPQLKAYFSEAALGKPTAGIGRGMADELTSALEEMRDSSVARIRHEPDDEPQQVMLTLNITHGCNMACRYCFASTDAQRMSVMSSDVAEKAIRDFVARFGQEKPLEAETMLIVKVSDVPGVRSY